MQEYRSIDLFMDYTESYQQSFGYKLFNDYYSKLVDIVPATDLSHYFVSDKIITLEDYDKIIRSPTPQEAAKILLDKISLQLQNGNSTLFNKMLLIMDHHGVATAKELSQEIRSKLFAVKHADNDTSAQSTNDQLKYSSHGDDAASADKVISTQPMAEEHISAEYEVFIHCFSQIVSSISAVALSPYFVQQNIISPSEQLEIFNAASPNKASGLLLSKISSALKAGFTKIFYTFLDITEQHGSMDSARVTNVIRKKLQELRSKDKGEDDVKGASSLEPAGEHSQTHEQ